MNQTLPLFQVLFEDQLKLLQNPACITCDADIKHPLIPWLVGDKFFETSERILFIGKPHRGIPGVLLSSGLLDPTEDVLGENGLWNCHWPYWSYTREIAERIYGSEAFRFVAFSNAIKCTNTHDVDATTPTMAQKCISELGVIWREIETIRPLTVIFYTYALYPEFLNEIPCALPGSVSEIAPYGHRVSCGAKRLGWWERTCSTSWAERIRILVVGHPERKNKADFTDRLVDWIVSCG